MSKPKVLTAFDNGYADQGYLRLGNKLSYTISSNKLVLSIANSKLVLGGKILLEVQSSGNYSTVNTIVTSDGTSYTIKDVSMNTTVVDTTSGILEFYLLSGIAIQINSKSNNYIETNFSKFGDLVITEPYLSGTYDTLEEYTWGDIDEISKSGNASDYFSVGDTKNLTINNVSYPTRIIGFNHDDLADGTGKAGITFQLVDCLNTTMKMNTTNINSTSWNDSYMRLYNLQLGCGITQFDEECYSKIKLVKKITSAGNTLSTLITTNDKLFLPSEIEIFGSTSYSKSGEGTQYAYYSAGNSKIKKVNGTAYTWWERSPRSDYSTRFCSVYDNGDAYANFASDSRGVSFCFCV